MNLPEGVDNLKGNQQISATTGKFACGRESCGPNVALRNFVRGDSKGWTFLCLI